MSWIVGWCLRPPSLATIVSWAVGAGRRRSTAARRADDHEHVFDAHERRAVASRSRPSASTTSSRRTCRVGASRTASRSPSTPTDAGSHPRRLPRRTTSQARRPCERSSDLAGCEDAGAAERHRRDADALRSSRAPTPCRLRGLRSPKTARSADSATPCVAACQPSVVKPGRAEAAAGAVDQSAPKRNEPARSRTTSSGSRPSST